MDLSDLSALMGEDLGAATAADVWVLLPAVTASAADLALVREARRLADRLGCWVRAVVAGGSGAPAPLTAGFPVGRCTTAGVTAGAACDREGRREHTPLRAR